MKDRLLIFLSNKNLIKHAEFSCLEKKGIVPQDIYDALASALETARQKLTADPDAAKNCPEMTQLAKVVTDANTAFEKAIKVKKKNRY